MTTFDELVADLPDLELDPAVQRQHLAYLASLPDTEPAAPGTATATRTDPRTDVDDTDSASAAGNIIDLAAQRRRRRRWLAGGISVAVILAGTGTAAAFGLFGEVTNTETAYCYASASLNENNTNRMEFATQGTDADPRDAAASGIDICAAYWRSGVFQMGKKTDINAVPTGGGYPVPPLVACVLPSGQAGIFPGDDTTCESLGLGNYRHE
jgi:hypothetical protein